MTDLGIQPGGFRAIAVTIVAATGLSEMFSTQGQALLGIYMPAWTAAAIGYKECFSGRDTDLVWVYDNGSNLEQTLVQASSYIAIPQTDTVFGPWLQLASVVAGATTAVAQGADRVLILLFRNYLT